MLTKCTTDKLIEMRLSTMADAYRIQQADPHMKELDFDQRFSLIVDREYDSRKSNKIKRLIHNAEFDDEQADASILDVNYTSGRKLNKELILQLGTCDYLTEYRNIFITGATGSGKSYLATAFGMEACKRYYTTYYVRMSDMLHELGVKHDTDQYGKAIARYTKPQLLIIDDWLLTSPTGTGLDDLYELFRRRRKKASTIFCS